MQYADAHCGITERYKPEHVYIVTGPYKDKPDDIGRTVVLKAPDLFKYRQGAMIQDAFPYLSADDREFLMSGYSPEAFAKLAEEELDDSDVEKEGRFEE